MKERPIIFSAPMVRAILEGRKTQTRRAFKRTPVGDYVGRPLPHAATYEKDKDAWRWTGNLHERDGDFDKHKCPYGQIGDRLWVRETFVIENTYDYHGDHIIPNDYRPFKIVEHCEGNYWLIPHYRATEPEPHIVGYDYDADDDKTRWKPSIHMPRWASRITLEITNVRVERLQDIGLNDAIAKGAVSDGLIAALNANDVEGYPMEQTIELSEYVKDEFKELWESINGEGSWEANPWVWVIEFKRIEREE